MAPQREIEPPMVNDAILSARPYSLPNAIKAPAIQETLRALTAFHYGNCDGYRRVLDALGWKDSSTTELAEIPYLPVGVFKFEELRSVAADAVIKVLTSSGTSSQRVSRIPLDRATAASQTRALVGILQEFLGRDRLPMLIIDHPGVIRNRTAPSARAAGILGLSNFGRDHCYALRDGDLSLDVEAVETFLTRHRGERLLVFGFTFMVWEYFLKRLPEGLGRFDLSSAVLLHSGGWKKLEGAAVTNEDFRRAFREHTGITRIHNFYGMAEQVGSIFVECGNGLLHTPACADVIARDPLTLQPVPTGSPGVLQVLSVLPRSYPGHSLLTEDLGTVEGVDSCDCGRLGRVFRVHGRLPRSETRGCSDTHAAEPAPHPSDES
jgi:hypothetical protein